MLSFKGGENRVDAGSKVLRRKRAFCEPERYE